MISLFLGPQAVTDHQNPAKWLLEVGHSPKSRAGVVINESTALNYSVVFACVRVVSEALGCMPWHVRRRVPNGSEIADTHRADRLLSVAPSPEVSPFSFKETMQGWAMLWGNGYAEIVRDLLGRPVGFTLLAPNRVKPARREDGSLIYEVGPAGKNIQQAASSEDTVEIPAEDMFHIRGPGNGLVGYSMIKLAQDSLGLGLAMERFGAAFFGNGARPAGVFKMPGKFDPRKGGKERFRKEIKRLLGGGADGSNRFAILEEGMEYMPVSVPPEDAQFLQSRQFQIPEICRWFNVQPSKVMDLTHGHFNNMEQQAIAFTRDTVAPWAKRWEEEANRKLLTSVEARTLFTKMNLAALMRGDSQQRAAFYKAMRDLGAFSPNDILELEDRNTLGPEGDVRLVPMNMQTLEKAADDSTETETDTGEESELIAPPVPGAPPDTAGLKKASAGVFAEVAFRLLKKEHMAVTRAVAKHRDDHQAFAAWVSSFYGRFAREAQTALLAPVLSLAEHINLAAGLDVLDHDTVSTLTEDTERYAMFHVEQSQRDAAVLFRGEAGIEHWLAARISEIVERLTDMTGDTVTRILELNHA